MYVLFVVFAALVSLAVGCCERPAAEKQYGMVTQRKCHDMLCCVLFAVFWIGMVIIAGIAFHSGNPLRLLYGTDYQGNVCGTGPQKANKYVAYPRASEDSLINKAITNPLDYKVRDWCHYPS